MYSSRILRISVMLMVLMSRTIVLPHDGRVFAEDLSREMVKRSIERGLRYLISAQHPSGAWNRLNPDCVGISSLCVLALLNGGMSVDDPEVSRGLQFLRSCTSNNIGGENETYQTSLLIMALVAAKQPRDVEAIRMVASRLEAGQSYGGVQGGWAYSLPNNPRYGGGDESNTQFAVLGLREAYRAGYIADPQTWEHIREYWIRRQNQDGGWGYGGFRGMDRAPSKGSLTVSGVASLAIAQQMLMTDKGVARDGTPPCCEEPEVNMPLLQGMDWLSRYFSVRKNPGTRGQDHILYYFYGVERAGRLSGQRFFGEHDWYREGAARLLVLQRADGQWIGAGEGETNPLVATSFSLLFLSKGLAPVLINKLKYGPRHPNNPDFVVANDWNRHSHDVRNLADMISELPKWPKLLTTQELDLRRAVKTDGLAALQQAPVLFITGSKRLSLTNDEISLIKDYVSQGGFILASPSCGDVDFETSFRELVAKLLPDGDGTLRLLTADHPVYRSEFLLGADDVPLWGADFGCRTSIIYTPEDLGCLWNYWAKYDPPGRNPRLKKKIDRATSVGVNVIAYFTGREPPEKLSNRDVVAKSGTLDEVERGLLQIAQIKHDGTWNAAPGAVRNLLLALNETVGLSASMKQRTLSLADKNIFRYPILFMHGRNRFTVPAEERQQLKRYLDRGGVLVADACCGAKPFDESFRELVTALYPDRKLDRIPVTHELFSEKVGQDIQRLNRRGSDDHVAAGEGLPVVFAEPVLEGIEVDGRYSMIYSKYDISCALSGQDYAGCEGYPPEDAVKLGTNIILYSMLQNLRLQTKEKPPE
ncbi:DUF4159 domain-containing protein [Schlesneria paludicola]|uniref:DUF4159 domain-containing protein n=1 Tax=Schlesneria paludicola TaxID=360056 RepID=UPI00058B3B38|nr:DUF4159 domain-containing protein [Schlesneria paludicola]